MPTSESAGTARREAVEKVYQAFFTPARYAAKAAEREVLERGTSARLAFGGGELAVSNWGSPGPAVLLMHGWGGGRSQMTGLVDPLLNAGYRVVAYDQPAHGESDGTMTSVLEIAPSMGRIVEQEGEFEAILGHSFGTLITSYALVHGILPLPARLVYFSALNRLMDSLARFQVLAKLPDSIMEAFRDKIYMNFDRSKLEAIANELLAPQLNLPALMFHDASDEVTPIEDSRAIARAWKTAELVETTGLGHRGGLQSSDVCVRVVRFLND